MKKHTKQTAGQNKNNLDTLELKYINSVPVSHIKKHSQFFTPPEIADFMADWVLSAPQCHTILDPAVGLGIFPRTILQKQSSPPAILGLDIDSKILQHCKEDPLLSQHPQITLQQKDYLLNDWNSRYDGIICNPPYARFQNYKNRPHIFAEFQSKSDSNLSGLTNLHSLFLLKSVAQLAENGRAAYILPSEFLNADYGTSIKEYLLRSNCLKYIIIFDYNSSVFENVLTTACILLLAREHEKNTVSFMTIHEPAELTSIRKLINSFPADLDHSNQIETTKLDPHIKWRAYYQKSSGAHFKNLVPLSTYGKFMRGIATGDNNFFRFNSSKAELHQIDEGYLLPCLTKAAQTKSTFFTTEDFEDLRIRDKYVFILNAQGKINPALEKYLQYGESSGVSQRYLTSHRHPWYTLESRVPAPILAAVFNRSGLRFIRNETSLRSLTCFHNFYPHNTYKEKIDLLMAYLLTDISKQIIIDNRREYGDGLVKFEPNDLNSALVIDFEKISKNQQINILEIYGCYRKSYLAHQPDPEALIQLNHEFSSLL